MPPARCSSRAVLNCPLGSWRLSRRRRRLRMPWQIAKRGDNWCVVKEGESEPIKGGCHASRSEALKHQRALYAKESRRASMEAAGKMKELVGSPLSVEEVSRWA